MMKLPYEIKFNDSFERLEQWILNNDRYGYDPYDFIGADWTAVVFGRNTNSKIRIKARKAITQLGDRYPRLLRTLFLTKKTINPKGMGLIAHSYLVNFERTHEPEYLKKAEEILDWLSNNYATNYKGISWGYPFNWYSRIYIPKNTPSSVVTGTVSEAFFKHYELTKSSETKKILDEIHHFFFSELKRFKNVNQNICFSYTPIDNFKVHNASLFTAVFFARYFSITGNDMAKKLAISSMNYVLDEQNEDGSFCYWSQEPDSIIDHFHTGYVLRHIITISNITEFDVVVRLKKAVKYFLENLYDEDGIPMFSSNMSFPKDAHSLSESILSLLELNSLSSEIISKKTIDILLINSVQYLVKSMQTDKGYMVWQIYANGSKNDFPFLRWCQAWTYLAYSKFRKEYESWNATTNELPA